MNHFTLLNLEKLKEISGRWAEQFQRQGGNFNEVTLYRYEAPLLSEDKSLRWAIVFDVTHWEFEDMSHGETIVNTILDPYLFLVVSCNFPEWCKDRQPIAEENSGITKHEQAFLKQSGFSTSPRYISKRLDFPLYFETNDFTDVYKVGAPENWRHQWLFIPLFKSSDLPYHVKIDTAVVLYPCPAKDQVGKCQGQQPVVIQTPLGTTWDQIRIRHVNDDVIQISYPDGGDSFSSGSLGFAGKPILFRLFKLFASNKGELRTVQGGKPIKASVSNLRKHLKVLFPDISGDPIKKYDKAVGWECNFLISRFDQDSAGDSVQKSDIEDIFNENQKIPARSIRKKDSDV